VYFTNRKRYTPKTLGHKKENNKPAATCILAPDSDCNLFIISPPLPITEGKLETKGIKEKRKKKGDNILN